jgi:UDP-N-acetylmuramoyl-L-alanyl-D-glutamate--2,6-diaminopimelate ligase
MPHFYQGIKNIGHFFETHFWRMIYGMPDSGMHMYGITGTNGKTTTSYILASILESAYGKEKVGMLTTVSFRIAGKEEVNTTKMTTMPSRKVFEYLSRMKRAGVEHVVLETTSHALHQHRLVGITLDGAIILNIAREHLDYHKTMERYSQAKEMVVSLLGSNAPLVGKDQDPLVRDILDRAEKRGIPVVRMTEKDIEKTITPLAGSINKENAASASLLAHAVRISEDAIVSGVAAVTRVPGRMEKIEALQGFTVIIDYAVTPDALERLYSDVKKETKGRILATLSAAGLRDRGKRPDMARTVAKYADYIIVTREDPWTENEEQIFTDLEKGLEGNKVLWERIVDRKEALALLLREASVGDIVVATGKGAERGMGIGKEIVPWNEREIIEGILEEI